jgi:hypothetical protein
MDTLPVSIADSLTGEEPQYDVCHGQDLGDRFRIGLLDGAGDTKGCNVQPECFGFPPLFHAALFRVSTGRSL